MGGYKDFERSEILEADDVNDYLQMQSVMVFDTDADRNNQLSGVITLGGMITPVLRAGMTAYVKSTGKLETYDGNGWVPYAFYNDLAVTYLEDDVTISIIAETLDYDEPITELPILFYEIFKNYVDNRWDINVW